MGGDERMSAALLDRLTHRTHILEFVGTSFRFRQQLTRKQGTEAVKSEREPIGSADPTEQQAASAVP